MENRSFQDEERANTVESQLKEAQMLAEEADRKYDEVISTSQKQPFMSVRVTDLTSERRVFGTQ
ncbi:unnamed protein product [Anisakis simplex]|uniref:Tropomyosin (inferred by orthology to a C. elegans protein) n=1 Tax=Anisakis simplex TaxID=6269 RepID=A0A0M3JMU0_ANISI|nr:unnamed protein product [Anisakis simplex]